MGEKLESLKTWAIIPVKPFNRAKSRLAPVLSPEEREALALAMFKHSVELLSQIHRLAGVLVVSRDTKALAIARDFGVHTLMESGQPDLNPALRRAALAVSSWGASGLLVMPADLPFVTADDIDAILKLGRYFQSVVIVPDGQRSGTNGLLLSPPELMPFSFGEGSFERHKLLAEATHATLSIYESPRMALDIDTPADLERYKQLSAAGAQPVVDSQQ
jgi:2-phospho-L-lactate guanylyltransferase